jgi:hypothetical protein
MTRFEPPELAASLQAECGEFKQDQLTLIRIRWAV